MASFRVVRVVSLLPPAASHRSCTHVVLVLVICLIMCSLLSSSHAKPCKCSSSSDQDQRTYTTENTTLDQIGLQRFNFNSSDSGSYLIVPWITELWEKSDDGTNLNEASFNVSFSMNTSLSSSRSNQQKAGSLIFAILPAYTVSDVIIPPRGSSNVSSQPVTIGNSQVSVNITCVDTVNTTSSIFYNSTAYDLKSTWIEISIQPPETSSAGAFNNYNMWFQYDRDRQLLSAYVTDSGQSKPENPIAILDRAISDITAPLAFFAFFSSIDQLLQPDTWYSKVEVLPGNSSNGKWSIATIVSVVLGSSVAMGAVVATTVYFYFNSKYRRWKKDFDQLAKSMQQLLLLQRSFTYLTTIS